MPMIFVPADDCIDDLSTAELAEALVKREKWRDALLIAEGKYVTEPDAVLDDLRIIAENLYLGRTIDDILSRVIYKHVGRIV